MAPEIDEIKKKLGIVDDELALLVQRFINACLEGQETAPIFDQILSYLEKSGRLSVIEDILDQSKEGFDLDIIEGRLRGYSIDSRDLASLLELLKDTNVLVEAHDTSFRLTSFGRSMLKEVEQAARYGEGLRIGQVAPFFGDFPAGSGIFCTELVNQLLLRTNYSIRVYTSSFSTSYTEFNGSRWLSVYRGVTPAILWDVDPATLILPRLLRDDLDLLHVHSYLYVTSFQAIVRKLARRTRVILHLHGGVAPPSSLDSRDRRKFIFKERVFDKIMGKFVIDSADKILSASRKDLLMAQEKWNIPKEKLEWIPPAVDTLTFKPAENNDLPKTILYVGRLDSWKDFQTLLDAAQLVVNESRDTQFIFAGTGKHLNDFAQIAFKRNLPMIFLGRVPHRLMPDLMKHAYATIVPNYVGGLQLACLESMSCGSPVIGWDSPPLREVVTHEKTGLLVQPENHERLADTILELIEDEPLRRKLSRQSRGYVVENNSWEVVFPRIMNAYMRVLTSYA